MPVELRCPDCRTRLRLAEAPDPGTEVECPECSTVFPAPDPDTGEVPDGRGAKGKPKRRPAADADADADRPRKKPAEAPKPKAPDRKAGATAAPKKRRAKQLKTNKTLLYALVAGGVVFVSVMGGLLYWYFTRVPVAVEMLTYLPEDCTIAYGANVEHLGKYPEIAKKAEGSYRDAAFKSAADALARAMGEETAAVLRYGVQGQSRGGSAGVVLRTLKDVPADALSKLPGAQEVQADGVKYYTATVDGLGQVRAFRPTDRLVVFAAAGVADGVFRNMLKGNKENRDKTLYGRAPALAKRTVRGTAWQLWWFDGDKPAGPAENARADVAGTALAQQVASITGSAKAMGLKASVGSKSIRLELAFLMNDASGAADQYTKFKDSTLAKQDDEEPPKWWKDLMTAAGGSKKVQAELLSNVGADYSGEVFLYKTQGDTKLMLEAITNIVTMANRVTGGASGGGGANLGGGGDPRRQGGQPQPKGP